MRPIFTFVITIILFHLSYGITVSDENLYISNINKKENRNTVVKNILVKEIRKDRIISMNGKVYKIQRNVKIIKNYTKKPLIAELHFKNKKLVLIILK